MRHQSYMRVKKAPISLENRDPDANFRPPKLTSVAFDRSVYLLERDGRRRSDLCHVEARDQVLGALSGMVRPVRRHLPEQTKFDTQEHSLKAILVIDLVIRFGAAVFAGQNAENTPTANSKE